MRELTAAPPDRSTRFYLGRRTADDARQISRWSGVTGEKGRWKRVSENMRPPRPEERRTD